MRLTLTLVDMTKVECFLVWVSLVQLAEGLKSKGTGVVQSLRAMAVPPEDSGSIPSPCMASYNCLKLQFQVFWCPHTDVYAKHKCTDR